MTGRLLIHSGVRCAFNVEKKKKRKVLWREWRHMSHVTHDVKGSGELSERR